MSDASPTATSRRLPTRILLVCAAIGAIGGLVIAPISVFSSSGPALAFPPLYALLSMVKLLPGLLAQTMLRRPGVALLTGVIVGLINIPFSAHGPMVFVSLASIGLMQEIPLAAFLYKRWNLAVLLVGSILVGLVLAWLGWRVYAGEAAHPAMAAGYWATAVCSTVAIVIAAYALGQRMRRIGVIDASR